MPNPFSPGGSKRLFVALPLEEGTQEDIGKSCRFLLTDPLIENYRFTALENLHLTLLFLGDVSAGKIPAIQEALSRSVSVVRKFAFVLDRFGQFPGGILFLEGQSREMTSLAEKVRAALYPLGFHDTKTFRNHITVARRKKTAPERMVSLPSDERLRIDVSAGKISLFESELRPGGPVYTEVFRCTLMD